MVCAGTFGAVLDAVIVPVYVPAPKLAGLMVTCRLLGVLPLLGVTANQVRPVGFVAATAVNGSDPESVLVIGTSCCEGPVPAKAVTVMADWPTFSRGVVLTFMVTGITSGALLDPGTVRLRLPLQTCDVVSPVVVTETTT